MHHGHVSKCIGFSLLLKVHTQQESIPVGYGPSTLITTISYQLPVGVGPAVNKLKPVLSDHHQMSLEGRWVGGCVQKGVCVQGVAPTINDLSHDTCDVPTPCLLWTE